MSGYNQYHGNKYDKYGGKRGNKENQGNLVKELLDEMVKDKPDWKKLFDDRGAIDKLTERNGEFEKINTTQLRKFFEEVKNIEYRLSEENNWSVIGADLWKLVPSIKYAAGRGNVPRSFSEFISKSVKAISESQNKKQTFLNFERIFEAIVAYHKYHEKKH